MFTVVQIERPNSQVKSGSDFPGYIQELKRFGVLAFETWVLDSHTKYFGKDNYNVASGPKYEALCITDKCTVSKFLEYLKLHQIGQTHDMAFCRHCAETGIEKWVVDLEQMSCTYLDKTSNEVFKEKIPG